MLAIAIATHIAAHSFFLSRIVQGNVCIVLHREDGSERVLSSRPYNLHFDSVETRWEYDEMAQWLLLFSYNQSRSEIMAVTPSNLRKRGETWEINLDYLILNKAGVMQRRGSFHDVPLYGDQVFGMDENGRVYFVRIESSDEAKVWSSAGKKMLKTQSLPRSLQSLISNEMVEKSLPKWPGWTPQKIEMRPELVPSNELWQAAGWSMPQMDSEVRTSISACWQSSLVWVGRQCYFKSGKSTATMSLDRNYYHIQSGKYPTAVASYIEPDKTFSISSNFLRFKNSKLFELNFDNGTASKLCDGVFGIQL